MKEIKKNTLKSHADLQCMISHREFLIDIFSLDIVIHSLCVQVVRFGAQEVFTVIKNISKLSAGYLYRAKLSVYHVDKQILLSLYKCCLFPVSTDNSQYWGVCVCVCLYLVLLQNGCVRLTPFTVHLKLSQTLLIGYTPMQSKKSSI